MFRLTPQRSAILDALRQSRATLTAADVLERMRRHHPHLGRATVFRNLDALVDAGLAQRFERSGHVYAYASCSHSHHHHLVCNRCHTTIEIDESAVAPSLTKIESEHGFEVAHQSLDFYGTCRGCRS